MRNIQRLAIVGLALSLSGCNSYWAKPLGTEDKYGVAKGDCTQRAYAEVPALMDRRSISAEIVDLNDEARRALIASCLQTKGWTLVQRGP